MHKGMYTRIRIRDACTYTCVYVQPSFIQTANTTARSGASTLHLKKPKNTGKGRRGHRDGAIEKWRKGDSCFGSFCLCLGFVLYVMQFQCLGPPSLSFWDEAYDTHLVGLRLGLSCPSSLDTTVSSADWRKMRHHGTKEGEKGPDTSGYKVSGCSPKCGFQPTNHYEPLMSISTCTESHPSNPSPLPFCSTIVAWLTQLRMTISQLHVHAPHVAASHAQKVRPFPLDKRGNSL